MPFLGKTPTKLLDANVNIDGGNIDGTTIGATSAASATVTTFTSTGIDDNATSTAITIDSSQQVIISGNGGSTVNSLDLTYNGSSGQANIQADSNGGDTILTFGTSASGTVAERMRINSSGKVGIGTSTVGSAAGSLLTLSASSAVYTQFNVGTSGGGAVGSEGSGLEFYTYTGNVGSETYTKRMTIDSSGNVGIGTTSPAATLDVAGQIISNDSFKLTANVSTPSGNAMFRPASNTLAFATNSNERVRIDSSGNVGIGTTTPASPLHIFNSATPSSSLSEGLTLSNNSGATNDRLPAITWDYGGAGTPTFAAIDTSRASSTGGNLLFHTATTGGTLTERMRIDSSGNIGLGVTPSAWGSGEKAFQILGTTYGGGIFASGNNVGTIVGANAYWDGTQYKRINAVPVSLIQFSGGATYFYRDGTGAANSIISLTASMTISSSGKVQIGTGSGNFTDALLTTRQAGNVIDWGHGNTAGYGSTLGSSSGSGAPFIGFSCGAGTTSNTFKTTGIKGSLISTDNAGSLLFSRVTTASADNQSATESMRIDSSGRLMIGTTSPISTSAFLSLYQATGNVYGQSYGAAILNGEQSIFQAGARASGTSADRYCAISVYKHSGITNAAPYLYLQEEDGNAAYYWTDNTGVLKYSNSAANVGTTGGGAVGAQTSDERLKNIEEGFEYGIETVKALTPIAYRRNDEESPERKLGFGAQTTQAIVPEVVFDTGDCLDGYDGEGIEATPKTDNTILGMEYVQLIPVLTKAIQEQQAMIETLQAQVAELQGA